MEVHNGSKFNSESTLHGRLAGPAKSPIPFPSVHLEDTDAERWLKAHDRLVKAAHAADRYLAVCHSLKSPFKFDAPVMKEFRAAVAEVKEIEAEQAGAQ